MIKSITEKLTITLFVFMLMFSSQINLISSPVSYILTKNDNEERISSLVQDFTNAVNSGDRETMKEFILNHYDKNVLKRAPIDMVIDLNMIYYFESGGMGYEIKKIHPMGDKNVKIDLYNNLTEAIVTFQIPLSPAAEINWLLTAKPALTDDKELKELTEEQIVERIDKCLTLLDREEEFSGTIIFSKGENILYGKAFGLASKEYNISNKLDTKFNLASVGKIFTSVAIMQLVERGNLSLEDPVSKFVGEDWLNPNVSSKIKIKHLLTHTSGLGDYFKEVYSQIEVPVFRNLNDYKRFIANDTLEFEPGSKFSYSNVGALLLGVVIEKISDKDYFEYLSENIFEPAGMINTGGFYKDRPVENRATGYTKSFENGKTVWDNNQFTRIMRGTASGGVYSTANDMLKFAEALRSNNLLSTEYTNLVFQSRSDLELSWLSYSFFINEGQAGKVVAHKGDGRGTNTNFKMYLDSGYNIVILSNYSRPSAQIVADVFEQLLEY